jgi:1-acyl-sn-glycerol-3-phosphate acyltransferase
VHPEALARQRGAVREGLDWLGHAPSARAGPFYRLAALVVRFLRFVVLRLRIAASGREHLPPSGGYLLVGAIHRGWLDPFLVLHSLPIQPRPWFLGSGPSAFDRRWKEFMLRRLGGILPVWRGGVGVEQHVRSAEAVLAAGGVFVVFPEGGIAGPVGELSSFRLGAALIALRSGAPILPFVMVGSDELYLGRRLASRVLPLTSVAALLGEPEGFVVPPPGSREELALARRLTDAFADVLRPEVHALAPTVVDPPTHPRRLRRLTWLLAARRGPGPGTP